MELTKHFFFNLSLLIVLLFLGLLWVERLNITRSIKIVAFFYLVISFFICLAFSYPIHEGFYLDLRNIPIIIGGLYMGLGPLLGLVTIGIRGMYGIDFDFWLTAIFYSAISFSLWRLSPFFLKQSSNQRILFSVGFTFLLSLIQTVLEFVHLPYPLFDVYFAFLFIQPLGVGMIAYYIEETRKSAILSERLLKVNRQEVIEKMGAAISHEIRNPLTAAIGFVQLLQSENISDENRLQYLSILRRELKSAERVIQDYLNLSKPEIKLVESLIVQEEIQRVIQLLQPSANRNSVQVITYFSHEATIEGDRQKFHQCLVNIMKNAIEAMPNGGILKVETHSTQTNVRITIGDTGSGMTSEQVVRLGEPYYSTKGDKGTGLGMIVVFSFIRAMNGTIHVESELGVGTTFEIMFSSSSISVAQTETKNTTSELVLR